MENWISYLLLSLGGALGLAVLWLLRQRRAQRLRLRLVSSQSHLVSAQLAQRGADLKALEGESIEELGRQAGAALDELHILLVERQAHLQNCEDLVHLQKQKLSGLATSPRPAPPSSRQGPPPSQPRTAPPQRRDHLEDQLLRQIDELNRKRRNPPKK
ncbi:MAG: hypothetical protein FJY95_18475 [Candidatus Handelsmanbacteria bacterium]|nr:hypothetical protein [Candidatus Handelsmanbacteria bacterium]